MVGEFVLPRKCSEVGEGSHIGQSAIARLTHKWETAVYLFIPVVFVLVCLWGVNYGFTIICYLVASPSCFQFFCSHTGFRHVALMARSAVNATWRDEGAHTRGFPVLSQCFEDSCARLARQAHEQCMPEII